MRTYGSWVPTGGGMLQCYKDRATCLHTAEIQPAPHKPTPPVQPLKDLMPIPCNPAHTESQRWVSLPHLGPLSKIQLRPLTEDLGPAVLALTHRLSAHTHSPSRQTFRLYLGSSAATAVERLFQLPHPHISWASFAPERRWGRGRRHPDL